MPGASTVPDAPEVFGPAPKPATRRAPVQRVRPSNRAMGEFVRSYTCAGRDISVGVVGLGLRLMDGGGVYELSPVQEGGGGQVYTGQGPMGTAKLVLNGEQLSAEVNGRALRACELTRRWPMPAFRALGHEPSWLLKGELELMHWTVADKLVSVAVQDNQPLALGQPLRMGNDPDAPVVEVRHAVCRDTATGMPFPYTVQVSAEGRRYAGCGGDTHAMLVGRTWVISGVEQGAIPLSPLGHDISIRFDGQGRVNGVAACNLFSGIYALTTERLSIGSLATTRRACPGGAMVQEHDLLRALETVVRFDVTPSGELTLVTRAAADRGEVSGITAR